MARLMTTDQGLGLVDADGDNLTLLTLGVRDLGEAFERGLTAQDIAAAPTRERLSMSQVRVLPPVVRPSKIWALGLAYASHVGEMGRQQDAEPFFFLKAPSSLLGAGQPIVLPRVAPDHVDYEGEVALVIGRPASHIAPEQAWSHVAGVTILNDVSARDIQGGQHVAGARPNTSMAKSFDTFTPCGPCLATLDEFASPDDIELTTFVNGEQRQHSRTSTLIWPVAELLSFLSARTTLEPGDIVSTGTPAGVGHAEGRYLKPGDWITIRVTGVGELTNPVTEAIGSRR
ncbi:MAG: fumarylacetoacetate hydrolase family protein [Chloroflexi bacterium]|nr:fumarylacetoacetate hydrolase family protein [Chloroflexota bacterium]